MNNTGIFQPLEILEKKPIPKQFERVKLFYKRKEGIDVDEETDVPEKPVEEVEEPMVEPKTIKVVDRRKDKLVDREAILNRLRPQMDVRVIDTTSAAKKTSETVEEKKAEPVRQLDLQQTMEKDIEAEEKAAEEKRDAKSRAERGAMHKKPDPYKARAGESD